MALTLWVSDSGGAWLADRKINYIVRHLSMAAALDEEERTGNFLRLLNLRDDVLPVSDQVLTLGLRDVLSMDHNASVGPRLAVYLAQFTADPSHAAAAACVNAAMHGFATDHTPTLPLGPDGREALLNGLEQVGLGARRSPFPSSEGKPCEIVRGAVISPDGVRTHTIRNEPLWHILCLKNNDVNQGNNMCYAIEKKIDDCRGGKKLYVRCFEHRAMSVSRCLVRVNKVIGLPNLLPLIYLSSESRNDCSYTGSLRSGAN